MKLHRLLRTAALFVTVPLIVASAIPAAAQTGVPNAVPSGGEARSAGAPNVVLILLDDVGFGTASTFGGPAATPTLDQLAKQGLRYNNFHTTALCSPTRAALLSGRNHHRIGFGNVVEGQTSQPGYNMLWPKSAASAARVLHDNGYSTAAFGKWHNTPYNELSPAGPFDRWPTGLGFDYFYGYMRGSSSQYETPLFRNTTPIAPPKTADQGYNQTTDLVDDAIGWLRTHRAYAGDRPYFLYMAPSGIHAPLQVSQDWIDRYKGKFDGGWDQLRANIVKRQEALGIIPKGTKLSPRPEGLPAWNSLSPEEKRLHARQMEVYAAFMAQTDHELGRLVEAVRSGPGGDNTIIMYVVGDNGASGEGGIEGSDRAHADYLLGTSAPVGEQLNSPYPIGGPDRDDHIPAAWAWAANAPFPYMKQVAGYLGGTRNPMVVSWPAGITKPGRLQSEFTHVIDVVPTIYEAAGIQPPATVDGVEQLSFDGLSFAKDFKGANGPYPARTQYFQIATHKGIYHDGWLASVFGTVPWKLQLSPGVLPQKWELYNLRTDFAQARDVAAKHPEKMAKLQALYVAEADRNHAQPIDLKSGIKGLTTSVSSGRKTLEFYPGMPIAQVVSAPNFSKPHRIQADILVPADGAEGIILSNGSRIGGLVLYVEGGHLILENNVLGRTRELVRSPEPLPAGKVEVAFEYSAGPQRERTGRLSVNGKVVAEQRLTPIVSPMFGTFEIGQSATSPVATNRKVPFAFTGRIDKVVVDAE